MNNHPDPNTHWKHRRRHAYIALIWIILQTFLWIGIAVWFPTIFPSLGIIISFSYTISTGILSAYYAGSSLQDYLDKIKEAKK